MQARSAVEWDACMQAAGTLIIIKKLFLSSGEDYLICQVILIVNYRFSVITVTA